MIIDVIEFSAVFTIFRKLGIFIALYSEKISRFLKSSYQMNSTLKGSFKGIEKKIYYTQYIV